MTDIENNMASPTDDAQRKIYVLPKELVDRIAKFQRRHGYPSEVEAVRHLLNKALLFSQTPDELISEVVCCLDDARATENMIRDLLMGHPLVATLTIQKNSCFVTLENGDEFQIGRNEQGLKKKLPSGEWSGWYTPTME